MAGRQTLKVLLQQAVTGPGPEQICGVESLGLGGWFPASVTIGIISSVMVPESTVSVSANPEPPMK